MQTENQYSAWVKKDDQTQCIWIINYLNKRNLSLRNPQVPYPLQDNPNLLVEHILSTWGDTGSTKLLFKEMKAAWGQKQNRDKKNGKKNYNFVMPSSIGPKLKSLSRAKGQSMNATVQSLILQGFGQEKHFNEKLKDAIDKEKKKLAGTPPKERPQPKNTNAEALKIKLDNEKRASNALRDIGSDRLLELCQHIVFLEDKDLIPKGKSLSNILDTTQKLRVNQMHKDLIEYDEKMVKSLAK
jgi:hypothetical protein